MSKPVKQPIEASLVARLSGAWNVLTGNKAAVNSQDVPQVDNGAAFFGPLNPIQPIVTPEQKASVVGRQFDFAPGYNLRQRPRTEEAVSFQQMRALADNCDVLRLVIETRKDQIEKMGFSVKPIDPDKSPDDRCKEVEEFLKSPDGESTWHTWLRAILEELFVTDAVTIYPWLNNDGTPFRFELVDGATIKRVLNVRGRTPDVPLPAYQQVLKGVPAVDYTRDELIYMPRNRRVNKVYGYSPVEQIVQTVNIAIRRSLYQLQYYTEGSTPDLLMSVPADWQMAQVKEFNDWWQNQLSGQTGERRKAQFVPHGVAPINTKEAILKDDYDEWIARIICYAFSVSPQAFAKQMNKATAQTAQEAAIQEGLAPLMIWIKSLMDKIIQKYFGYLDLEYGWDDENAVAPLDQNKIDDTNVKNGTNTINEVRAARGDPPVEGGDVAMCLTPTGYVPIIPAEPPEPPAPIIQHVGPDGQPVAAPVVPVVPPEGDKPVAKPGEEPDEPAKEPDKPVGKSFSKSASIAPLDPDRPEIAKARDSMAKKIKPIFQAQLKEICKDLSKMEKGNDLGDNVDWEMPEEWQDMMQTSIAVVGKVGVNSAYAQLDLEDKDAFSLANDDAIAYAKSRAAELVGKRVKDDGTVVDNPNPDYTIDGATREMIRNDISEAMESGWSNDKLANKLQDAYAFSDTRAEAIARTETAFADSQGNLAMYKRSEVVESKKWNVGDGCCDECQAMDGEVVGLDEPFSDGSDAPPAHPECRCAISPVLSNSGDNTEE